jgi:hypothetical protein
MHRLHAAAVVCHVRGCLVVWPLLACAVRPRQGVGVGVGVGVWHALQWVALDACIMGWQGAGLALAHV